MFAFNKECNLCKNKLQIFEDNYKCLYCKEYFCQKCSENHKKDNINNILINLYEIGYICEEHYQNYTTFCGQCKKNLCIKCVFSHYHKVDQKNIYEINKKSIEIYKNKNLNEITELDEYISCGLCFNYIFMKDFSFNNLFIHLGIWFAEKKTEKMKKKNINFISAIFMIKILKNIIVN